jgi:hypothetical protein
MEVRVWVRSLANGLMWMGHLLLQQQQQLVLL